MKKLWAFVYDKGERHGAGLAICMRIVKAHGGGVSVESAVDKGTTFAINIPVEPKSGET